MPVLDLLRNDSIFGETAPPLMKLLVVEDEEDLRRTLVAAFSESGYAVDWAADGTGGLYKAAASVYDAIILDIMLPGIDDWEILRQIRAGQTTPVLLLAALDGPKDRVRGLDGGADDYVAQPFDLDELQARLRALIRRST